MKSPTLPDQLEAASYKVDRETGALMRRAALALRNKSDPWGPPIPKDWSVALFSAAMDLSITDHNELLVAIIKDWLQTNGRIPWDEIDEATPPAGTA
jgi:hypothetical protein